MLKGQTAQAGVHLNTTYIHSFRKLGLPQNQSVKYV